MSGVTGGPQRGEGERLGSVDGKARQKKKDTAELVVEHHIHGCGACQTDIPDARRRPPPQHHAYSVSVCFCDQ